MSKQQRRKPRVHKRGTLHDTRGGIVLFEPAGIGPALKVRLEKVTVWLTQAQMAELFQRDLSVVTGHLRSVLREKELDKKSIMQKTHIVSSDRPVAFYDPDDIISVGYRVNSK
jgi:hypothetical protein